MVYIKKCIIKTLLSISELTPYERECFRRALKGPRLHFTSIIRMLSLANRIKRVPDGFKRLLVMQEQGVYR